MLGQFKNIISRYYKYKNENDEPFEIYADNGIEWHKNDKKYPNAKLDNFDSKVGR